MRGFRRFRFVLASLLFAVFEHVSASLANDRDNKRTREIRKRSPDI